MDLRVAIKTQTDFCLQIAKLVGSKRAKDSNLVFSPLSIHVALSLVAAGSKGQTLEQLCSILKFKTSEDLNSLSSQIITLILADGSSNGGPLLNFVNGVWIDESLPLKTSFKETVTTFYKAEPKSVNFQTKAVEVANEANSWVESKTSGLIKELLPSGSVDSSTRLVLANALYFKGAWKEKFDGSKTKDDDFFLLDGSSARVPFMTTKKKQFLSSFNGFKVLSLPYKQGDDKRQFSLCIFLPDERDGLWNLLEKLGSDSEFLDRHIPPEEVGIGEFRIPKFKISFGFEASEVLKGLGLVLPFSGEGELTEIVESSQGSSLYVSSIFHKSFIEVNEEGTEAAAATAAVIKLRGLLSRPLDFVADHPFVFMIREDLTGVVLFMGHVLNPLLTA